VLDEFYITISDIIKFLCSDWHQSPEFYVLIKKYTYIYMEISSRKSTEEKRGVDTQQIYVVRCRHEFTRLQSSKFVSILYPTKCSRAVCIVFLWCVEKNRSIDGYCYLDVLFSLFFIMGYINWWGEGALKKTNKTISLYL
jgi:hypothetical protein